MPCSECSKAASLTADVIVDSPIVIDPRCALSYFLSFPAFSRWKLSPDAVSPVT